MWQHVYSSDMLCSSWNVRGDFYSMMYLQGSRSPAQGAASGVCHSPVLPNPYGPEASPVSPLLIAADEEIITQGWKGNLELSWGNILTCKNTLNALNLGLDFAIWKLMEVFFTNQRRNRLSFALRGRASSFSGACVVAHLHLSSVTVCLFSPLGTESPEGESGLFWDSFTKTL